MARTSARTEKTIRVYEVLHYLGDDGPSGPMGDGHMVTRFNSKRGAETFARGKTCYGKPAHVDAVDAPVRVANRWGFYS